MKLDARAAGLWRLQPGTCELQLVLRTAHGEIRGAERFFDVFKLQPQRDRDPHTRLLHRPPPENIINGNVSVKTR